MRHELSGFRVLRASVLSLFLLIGTACAAATPTRDASPAPQERAALLRQPTLTPRLITALTPPNSPAPTMSTLSCGAAPCARTMIAPLATLAPAESQNSPALPPVPTAVPAADTTIIGYSAEGRPLTAQRFGSGERVLLLVGGIHGGWEANTVRLTGELSEHFALDPQDVPPGTALVIVPVANPDGLARGRVWDGRLNANGVDLNRNWACNWSPDAYWQQARVNPGASAFSEPETQALSAYIDQLRPRAALFYHSRADGVFAGSCGGDHGSAAMSVVYGTAAGYRYGAPFSAYPVTGTAADWLDRQGISAADVELITSTDSEFSRNLRGVLALLRWLADSTH